MISHWMKCAVLGTALVLGTPVVMAQGSAAFAPTTQLAGQTLQLNGQGVRYRTVIPVYEMGLYTAKKVTTPEQLLSLPGPKRASFVALRDFPVEQMGLSLVRGMRENADPAHAIAVAGYMDKLGQQRGFLILFEKKSSEELPWETRIRREIHEVDGREVVLLGM